MYKKKTLNLTLADSGGVIRQIILHFNTSAPFCLQLNLVKPTTGPQVFWLTFSVLLKTSAPVSTAVKVFMASSKLKWKL